jgi:membrane-bound metal-dependent hydrolase YbcI (DUF457 family)
MFLGHFAVAFAAKPLAPRVSLGTLFLAAQLADLAWPMLVLLGVERFAVQPGITAVTPLDFIHYPYSHSLAALALWGAALGAVYVFVRKGGRAAALVLAALVVSHWVLDFASHRPDMPLAPGSTERLGLGLWHSLPATLAVEAALFAAGIAIYARCTRALDRAGTWALAGLVAFLSVVYLASVFGPPPPSVAAVAWSAQAIWLLVAWGYWVDRHRAGRKLAE